MLPFGLSLSPRVFVPFTEEAIAPLRWQGIHLDDWLLLAQSEQEAAVQIRMLLQLLQDLGFIINWEKSRLSSVQDVVFLGLALNYVTFTALGRVDHDIQGLSRSILVGQDSQVRPVPKGARTDGICHPRSPAGTRTFSSGSHASPCMKSAGYT